MNNLTNDLQMEIIPYESKYNQAFVDLNFAWLEKYFEVEPYDKKQLQLCNEMIIKPGGCIYLGIINGIPIGSYALVKVNHKTCELSKMTIKEPYQGNGLGKQLVEHGIATAKKMNFEVMVLYTHRKLQNAIHIYRKYGFKDIEVETNCPYLRCNTKMELKLV